MVCQAHPSSLPGERHEAPPSRTPHIINLSAVMAGACPGHPWGIADDQPV